MRDGTGWMEGVWGWGKGAEHWLPNSGVTACMIDMKRKKKKGVSGSGLFSHVRACERAWVGGWGGMD